MYHQKLTHKLKSWDKQLLTRSRKVVSQSINNSVIVDGDQCINFCSNDYLGLSQHPAITAAFSDGVVRYGFGSGSSAMVAGYYDVQQNLEKRFAQWLEVDRAILFNSGYLANIGVITALVGRSDYVVSDKLCHASLLDAVQLSRAGHRRYRHNDVHHLRQLLDTHRPNLLATESVFSMEGDIAPISKILTMAADQDAMLVIDDAHGIGVMGENGRGIIEYAKCSQAAFSCVVMPLGKAFNGVGAMVAGREEVIETILQFSRSHRYTTALPPAICSALSAALDVVMADHWRRRQLQDNIEFFNEQAAKYGLSLVSDCATPIRSIVVGENNDVLAIQQSLLQQGFFVSCIRPPTVPAHTARVRISLNCLHTQQQILDCLACLAKEIQR